MFKNVIIGVDEHEGGRDAVVLGRKLVDAEGVLTLVHVRPGDPHVWRGSSPAYEVVVRDDSQKLLEQVRNATGVDARLKSVAAVSPGRGLHVMAEASGADLLVVGSSRRSLLGRVMVGDDTRAALNGASCAVAIAPAGYSHDGKPMRDIGVGYDGSPESRHAIEVGRQLAGQFGAKLLAFKAVSLPTYAFSGGYVAVNGDLINELVADARNSMADLGVDAQAGYGFPEEELATWSALLDLLIVGSRGYGPLGRVVHGSTSLRLAKMARCPLLVLTRTADVESSASMAESDQGSSVVPVG